MLLSLEWFCYLLSLCYNFVDVQWFEVFFTWVDPGSGVSASLPALDMAFSSEFIRIISS